MLNEGTTRASAEAERSTASRLSSGRLSPVSSAPEHPSLVGEATRVGATGDAGGIGLSRDYVGHHSRQGSSYGRHESVPVSQFGPSPCGSDSDERRRNLKRRASGNQGRPPFRLGREAQGGGDGGGYSSGPGSGIRPANAGEAVDLALAAGAECGLGAQADVEAVERYASGDCSDSGRSSAGSG